MPLTDENGRHLGALLNYLLDGQVTTQQIYLALGMSSSGYYRRIKQDDFPNAHELHKIARSFGLSFTDLQVRLGFLTREDLERYVRATHDPVDTARGAPDLHVRAGEHRPKLRAAQ